MTSEPSKNTNAGPIDGAALEPKSGFGRAFWMCNSIEAFERLAYFGIRAVVPIYIMQATEPGGLHLTAIHKGWIYMWWAIFQSYLPMVTGGFADRYGYKKILGFAISANVIGYIMMAFMHNYYGFFAGILVLATGTAFFKPALQGTIAQNLTKETSSVGWGIFYWVVNIGAFGAPIIATLILGRPHSAEGWRNLFLASAIFTSFNLVLLLTFKDVPSGANKSDRMMKVLATTIENIWPFWFVGGKLHTVRGPLGFALAITGFTLVAFFSDNLWHVGLAVFLIGGLCATWLEGGKFTWQLRLPAFLAIMSCFWMMMYQLWDLHPNFIVDWVDSSMVASHVPEFMTEFGDRGLIGVSQQNLLNLNAALIIILILPISWIVRKMRTLSAMLIGMTVATMGVLLSGMTGNGWFFLSGVVFFSLGEMLTGPKKNQYLGLIAPPGKKGLYLGYVNIPVGVGVALGSMIAGIVYDNYGEKATLALKHMTHDTGLIARAAQAADWSDTLEKIPALTGVDRNRAFAIATDAMGVEADVAAENLRDAFRQDRGQIGNLALQYVARHEDNRKKATKGLAKTAAKLSKELAGATSGLSDRVASIVDADPEQELTTDDRAKRITVLTETTRSIFVTADEIKELSELSRRVTTEGLSLQEVPFARFVHLIPDIVGAKRGAAFDLARDLVNKDLPDEQHKPEAEVVDMLWKQFGDDPDVLNNLGLEYLAQATRRVRDAVEEMTFRQPEDEIDKRIKEIEQRIGIDRTKAFAALSVALGADAAEVDAALDALDVPNAGPHDRAFVFLVAKPHHRFNAVARKDWRDDRDLLREMIRPDQNALQIVLAEIDIEAWYQPIWNSIKGALFGDGDRGVVTEEGVNYHRLADKQDLIQKALGAKDWTKSPDQAARLLGLSAYEARSLVAAEVAQAPLKTTRLLWTTYHPQYKVWIPFAAVGVLAIIALAIFGQMAKRWADMNA